MESTSISDVRRMCQRGAFRAYVQGGKVFLEDTATGQVTCPASSGITYF